MNDKSALRLEQEKNLKSIRVNHVLLISLVLINVILINLIVHALPVRYTEFDISNSGLFTLSEETKELLHQLDTDVVLYYLGQTGAENTTIINVLNRYADESEHLSWEQKDPGLFPTFAAQYDAADASIDSVIVVSNERSRVINAEDFYEIDYSRYFTDGTYTLNLDAENQITSALLFVTLGQIPEVYVLNDHGEDELSQDLIEGLTLQNIGQTTYSILSAPEIPQDAAAVLINTPTDDFSTEDISVLRDYLRRGGSLFILTNPSVDTPNLLGLLEEYGLSAMEGLVIEGDSNMHLRSYPQSLLPKIRYADAVKSIYGTSTNVLLPFCSAIEIDEEREDLTCKALLSTSDLSYNKAAGFNLTTIEKENGDLSGPFTVAASVEFPSDGDQTGRIVWVNSAAFLSEATNQSISNGNQVFTIACLSWMTNESTVIAAAKSLQSDSLVFTAKEINIWGNLFTIVLPVIVILGGVVITVKRRAR